jgi:outer membrane protein TolC
MYLKTYGQSHPGRISCVLIWAGLVLASAVIPRSVDAAESPRSFSLQEARAYAARYNYDARKSQLEIAAAQKRMRETLAAGLPQVTSSLGYINNLELATVLIPNFFEGKLDEKIPVQFGTQHNANLGLQVQQLVFNGSYFVGLQASRIYSRLAEEGFERTRMDVIETVSQTYYLILVSEESQRIIRGNLENLEKTLYEIRERYKEGFLEETDADVVQISVTALKNSLQNLQKQTKTAYQLLKFQLGIDLDENIALTDKLESIVTPEDIAQALSGEFSLEENIDYRFMQTQEKLAEMNLKNEKAKYWPTVAAFYSLSFNAFRDTFNFFNLNKDWYRTQTVGVNVNFPLFKSGAQKARVQQASLALEQARTTARQASEGLVLEEAQAENALASAFENYQNIRDNMELSRKVYDKTLIKYQEGLASSTDLTQANDRFLATQGNYIQALAELLNAKNKLDRIRNAYDVAEQG